MKSLIYALLFCMCLFPNCTQNKSLQVKFDTLKNIDFSGFKNMNIVNRKDVYFVTYNDSTYKIKRNLFSKRLSLEKMYCDNNEISLSKQEITHIDNVLKAFEKIDVLTLSVDEKDNVFISVPWYDQCTYHFLKLSPENTLKDINKQYYHIYEDNWYMDKECAER